MHAVCGGDASETYGLVLVTVQVSHHLKPPVNARAAVVRNCDLVVVCAVQAIVRRQRAVDSAKRLTGRRVTL
jgi:hypothetical protein